MATNSEWTDELKDKVVEAYESREPTPENTMDIVAELAEEFGKTIHGIRMVLSSRGAYVKKAPAAKSSSSSTSDKPKRVSKQDAIDALVALYEDNGMEPNMEILGKLTGKAAQYFTESITTMLGEDED